MPRPISTRRNALSLIFLQRRHMPPFPETKLKGSNKPAQLTGACHSTDRLIQKPSQPRLLSTSYNSWHSVSNAVWQLRATSATSQSWRQREILSPDPCNPITYTASLLHVVCLLVFRSLTSAVQLWWNRKPSPMNHKSRPLLNQKKEKLALRPDAGPHPNQLPEDHRLFLQKEEEELALRPASCWDIPLRGGCAQAHSVPSIQKRPQDLFPQRKHQI